MRRLFVMALPALLFAALPARSHTAADWYTKAVRGVTAAFEPAEARPGQTVTLLLTVDLHDGYFTYPLMQKDKGAANFVNKLVFPAPGSVVFVGEATDPAKLPTKADDVLGFTAMRYCPGTTIYSRKAVVSPKAAAGEVKVALSDFKLSVCTDDNCFPAKSVPVAATLKVLDGPPVAVEPAFADEVAQALAGK